jgi:hypothetical protein
LGSCDQRHTPLYLTYWLRCGLTFCPDCLQTVTLLMTASKVAGIIAVSYRAWPPCFVCLFVCFLQFKWLHMCFMEWFAFILLLDILTWVSWLQVCCLHTHTNYVVIICDVSETVPVY